MSSYRAYISINMDSPTTQLRFQDSSSSWSHILLSSTSVCVAETNIAVSDRSGGIASENNWISDGIDESIGFPGKVIGPSSNLQETMDCTRTPFGDVRWFPCSCLSEWALTIPSFNDINSGLFWLLGFFISEQELPGLSSETDADVRSTKTFELYCKHREALVCADQSAECSSVAVSPTCQPEFLLGWWHAFFYPSCIEPAR